MYKPTLFLEILKLLPRDFVNHAVQECESDSSSKKFKTWHHLVSMLYAHFSGVNSLRTLVQSLGSHKSAQYHFGNLTIKRSTLSDANHYRSAEVFKCIFEKLLTQSSAKQQTAIKKALKVLDSTCIPLKGRGNEWTESTATNRCQGLKIHVGIDYADSALWFANTTHANVNDVTVAQTLPIEEGHTYVFDKGYCDYNWWAKIHGVGAFFVTRLKQNATYNVIERHKISRDKAKDPLLHQTIALSNHRPRGGKINKCAGIALQLVHIPHPSKPEKVLAIITNDLSLSAEEIAECYKKRWRIELLFKFLKQNIKLKKFIGESCNAVLIQIYTGLIGYILLMMYQKATQAKASLFEVLTFVKAHLMNLVTRINSPPSRRHNQAPSKQMMLFEG